MSCLHEGPLGPVSRSLGTCWPRQSRKSSHFARMGNKLISTTLITVVSHYVRESTSLSEVNELIL